MEYQSHINDFIDGVITPEDEDKLFKALSYDKKTRQDFRLLMDLENISRVKSNSAYVSATVTENLFNKLNIPLGDALIIKNSEKSFLKKYSQGLYGSLITICLLAVFHGAMFVHDLRNNELQKGGIIRSSSNLNNSGKKKLNLENKVGFDTQENHLKAGNLKENRNQEILNQTSVVNKSGLTGNISNFVKEEFSETELSRDTIIEIANGIFPKTFIDKSSKHSSLINEQLMLSSNSVFKNEKQIEYSNFSLELIGMSYSSFRDEEVSRNTASDIGNAGLGLKYQISDNLFIGTEIRKENFYLDYQGKINEMDYNIYQNTNYTAYGLFLQHNLFEAAGFKNYVKLYGGANRIGAIARANIGFEFSFNDAYSMIIGCEGSSLFYKQDKQNFTSNKIGLYYGILLRI